MNGRMWVQCHLYLGGLSVGRVVAVPVYSGARELLRSKYVVGEQN